MKTKKQNADFVQVGEKLIAWYSLFGRDLPFRKTTDPYRIWICEIIFQQTRIEQGLSHYQNFIARFPDVHALARAETDDVLLYWKGLGYYSRALNLHKAAQQIVNEHHGIFPRKYEDILKLKGIGKYTAAAISSICFGKKIAAVDGNFYRVLSRIFADDFDTSNSKAFDYFSRLALQIMPQNQAGNFNQAMMDLGSEICKPRNPSCGECPLNSECIAFNVGKISSFPVKTKKTKVTDLELPYFFVHFGDEFLIRRRTEDFIWKKLYEFPTSISADHHIFVSDHRTLSHKLTHKNLTIPIRKVTLPTKQLLQNVAKAESFQITNFHQAHGKSFPKPLQNYLSIVFNEHRNSRSTEPQ